MISTILSSFLIVLVLIVLAVSMSGLIAGGIGFYLTLAARFHTEKRVSIIVRTAWLSGVPFAIVGVSAGYMTGLSREPAVGALVPAALTIVGGIGIYLYGKSRKAALLGAFTILNFTILLLLGLLVGAVQRTEQIDLQQSIEYHRKQIEKEFILERYRRGLGLGPARPANDSRKELEKSN